MAWGGGRDETGRGWGAIFVGAGAGVVVGVAALDVPAVPPLVDPPPAASGGAMVWANGQLASPLTQAKVSHGQAGLTVLV